MTSLSVYVDASATATRALVGLYASAGSHAGALLTQGTITAPKGGAWNTVTVPAASVTAGTTYWIALLGPAGAGTLAFRDKGSGGSPCETSSQGVPRGAPGDLERRDLLPRRARVGLRVVVVLDDAGAVGGPGLPVLRRDPGRLGAARAVGGRRRGERGALPFTTTTDAAWLSATPASGTAPADGPRGRRRRRPGARDVPGRVSP